MSSNYPLKIRKYHLHFNLPKPLRILHTSDTHLLEANEFDKPLKHELTNLRINSFEHEQGRDEPGSLEAYFAETIKYAQENNAIIVHTGDLIDFISDALLKRMTKVFSDVPMLFTPGNHEYITEIWPDKYHDPQEPYSEEDIKRVMPYDPEFHSVIYGGVNFVLVDNAKYQFTARQLQRFNEEADRGLPIIMLCHVQIHTPENYAEYFSPKHPCAYTVGCPEELMSNYPEALRLEQKPTKETLDFIEGISKRKELRAVLCGHHHLPFESELFPGVIQRVVGGGYLGYACEYIID